MSILVCLDPGHGGEDQGAVGFALQEKEVCLDLAYRIERQLHHFDGIKVTMTRSLDINTTPHERSLWANSQHADLFLSIHTNASADPSATGFSSYVSVIAGSHARRIQCWLHNRIANFLRTFGIMDLGKKNDTETFDGKLTELRQVEMPAITLGSLFITHAKDNVLLRDASFRDEYAKCIAQGIANIYRCRPKS